MYISTRTDDISKLALLSALVLTSEIFLELSQRVPLAQLYIYSVVLRLLLPNIVAAVPESSLALAVLTASAT